MPTFAVVKTGGKQYIVKEGDVISVEKLEHAGNEVIFDQVFLVADEKRAVVGQPLVDGAKVSATVIAEGKGDKKIVFRYKAKTRSKKKKGHRQLFTKVRIEKILAK